MEKKTISAGIIGAGGFMRRYDPDYCKIKAILDSGELGKPLMAHCISRTPRITAGFTNAMQVTNVLIHEIDQFRWLFGEELVRGQMLAARNTKFAADGLNDPQLALMWTESNGQQLLRLQDRHGNCMRKEHDPSAAARRTDRPFASQGWQRDYGQLGKAFPEGL